MLYFVLGLILYFVSRLILYFVHIQADCVFCILADVVFHKKDEQEIREEFLKLDTDRSGFITKGERFKLLEIPFA